MEPDAAPTEELNRILWRNARGGNNAPKAKRAAFSLFSDPHAGNDDE
jgi:hypothetical protein